MQTKKIKIKGKEIEVEVCNTTFSKFRGLMFRINPKPLLFIFKKPTNQRIHSFFCQSFHAYWMLNGKIIDEKIVNPFKISIKPKGKFTELLEVPLLN